MTARRRRYRPHCNRCDSDLDVQAQRPAGASSPHRRTLAPLAPETSSLRHTCSPPGSDQPPRRRLPCDKAAPRSRQPARRWRPCHRHAGCVVRSRGAAGSGDTTLNYHRRGSGGTTLNYYRRGFRGGKGVPAGQKGPSLNRDAARGAFVDSRIQRAILVVVRRTM